MRNAASEPVIRPFFWYFGGKWRATRTGTYPPPAPGVPIVEPFAGSAGYATVHGDRDVVLVERDPTVAGVWRFLIGATRDDILSIPDLPDGGTTDDIDAPQAARGLVGFWLVGGAVKPQRRMVPRARIQPGIYWGPRVRERLASQVHRIKHWTLVEGDYTAVIRATWFVDHPYQGLGRSYRHRVVNYTALAAWCTSRRGSVTDREAAGADWLPFREVSRVKRAHRPGLAREAVWTR